MEYIAPTPHSFLPLTPIVFHILMALTTEERHGYGIIKEVQALTDGQVNIQTGTLYQAIKRLLEAGLVEAVESKVDPQLDDQRRRYYALSGLGEEVLKQEVLRLEKMLQLARSKKILGSGKVSRIHKAS
jgi:DNA-binding PadR family transcriptional regulator